MASAVVAHAESERVVPMRVIVCGLQRTGTLSLRTALRQLGVHDVYHMHSFIDDTSTAPTWIRAIRSKFPPPKNSKFAPPSAEDKPLTKQEWDVLLSTFQATCDLPAALFTPELAAMYPSATVILLNRDPDSWHDSVRCIFNAMRSRRTKLSTLLRAPLCILLDPVFRRFVTYIGVLNGCALAGFDPAYDREAAQKWFLGIYDDVRRKVAPERRLEYNIKEGWAPLCKHLGVPVPQVRDEKTGEMVDMPFPRSNDTREFLDNYDMIMDESFARASANFFRMFGRAAFVGVVVYGGWAFWQWMN